MKTLWEMYLKNLSLRYKLVLAFLMVSVLTGASLIFLSQWAMKGALNLMAGADLQHLADAKALAAGNLLARQVDVLQSLSLNHILRVRLMAVNASYREGEAATQARLADLDHRWITADDEDWLVQAVLQDAAALELRLFQRRFPDHVEVFLTDKYGGLIAATGRTEDYYQADEAWWTRVCNEEVGGVSIDTLLWDPSSETLGVRIVVPIFDQDNTTRMGMLVSIYRLDMLYALISSTTAEHAGQNARLLLPDGRVLTNGGETLTAMTAADWERIQAMTQSPYTIQPFEGVQRFVSQSPVMTIAEEPIIVNLGWRVLVYQDQQAALMPLAAQQRINLIVSAAAIVVSGLVGTWIAYHLSWPVQHLTTTAQRIAGGDLDAVAPVAGSDEIGVLAATFNMMTARLRATLSGMKQQLDELHAAQAALQVSEARFRQIMDTVPEGVLLLDADLRVQVSNPAAQIYLQALASPAAGTKALTHLGDCPIAELLTSPPEGLWHTLVYAKRHFQVIARPVEIGPTMEGWILAIRDVTSEHEAQQKFQQQARLAVVGQLAAGIAHDFNNILAGIVLYSQMSLRMADLPSKLRERLTIIAEQSSRAADLITQILDFSRRAVLDRQPLDLTPLLKEQVKLWERTLPETIHITLTGEDADYTVNADPTRIQQVLMNLVVNARDAMPDGGHLHIGLARIQVTETYPPPLPELSVGEWVQVTVADTGVGIPDDVLSHLFEPFFTTKEPGKGTGLGLAQVYGIIKAHEGQIRVQTQPGVGTTFTFYLPALLSEPRPVLPQNTNLPLGHGETILVVEDNATTRTAVVESLELLHYRTIEAADGAAALEIFARQRAEIALVLTDMVMPQMGGKALAQAVHQQAPEVPVVIMSGHPLTSESDTLQMAGVVAWIQKPPDLTQMAEMLAGMVPSKSSVK